MFSSRVASDRVFRAILCVGSCRVSIAYLCFVSVRVAGGFFGIRVGSCRVCCISIRVGSCRVGPFCVLLRTLLPSLIKGNETIQVCPGVVALHVEGFLQEHILVHFGAK